ncbi:MAG: PQQ-binding-like beta-propeller repeat protein [Gammaproteobacteria bacterium]|nr:PQQ-binding-like beta-propeller repeat protein [Gammaproteobacteria bacterium]
MTNKIQYLPILVLLLGGCAGGDDDITNSDWTLYGNNYGNQRYSPLAQVNRDNVSQLTLAWRYETGRKATFQTNPLIRNGVMYISTPFNDVVALDAASGEEIWRYHHQLRDHDYCRGPANRGVALSHGKVIMGTIDARLVALDQETGSVVWDKPITDPHAGTGESLRPVMDMTELEGATQTGHSGYTANMAPQVFEDKVYIGISGAGYGLHLEQDRDGRAVLSVGGFAGGGHGLRGFLVAYDVDTGDEIWRWYPVTGPDWAGDFVTETAYGVGLNRDIAAEKAAAKQYTETWRLRWRIDLYHAGAGYRTRPDLPRYRQPIAAD